MGSRHEVIGQVWRRESAGREVADICGKSRITRPDERTIQGETRMRRTHATDTQTGGEMMQEDGRERKKARRVPTGRNRKKGKANHWTRWGSACLFPRRRFASSTRHLLMQIILSFLSSALYSIIRLHRPSSHLTRYSLPSTPSHPISPKSLRRVSAARRKPSRC